MNRLPGISLTILASLAAFTPAPRAAAQYAEQVVSYSAGSTPAIEFDSQLPYDLSASALGQPERFTGEGSYPSVVSPFSPPYSLNEIVSVGEGGELTLRLSHFAVPQADAPEIGVFTNVGILDSDYPNGLAGSPPFALGTDAAEVSVSEDGLAWISLGSVTFDIPMNGYTDLTTPFADSPGSSLSDFQTPFTGMLSDFAGLTYYDAGGNGMLDLLDGSGGGTWLDISATGLSKVGYVRFAVADDLNEAVKLNFELDAVSVSHAAMGLRTVPEPTSLALAGLALAMLPTFLRRPRRVAEG
jgi:hypothetical protein